MHIDEVLMTSFWGYKKENDEYVMYDGDKILYQGTSIGVLFDKTASVLLKHGLATKVKKYSDECRVKYLANGLIDIAEDLVYVESTEWDTEELNKCLHICDYVGRLAIKLGWLENKVIDEQKRRNSCCK